jgi:hypothetical protein
MGRVAFLFLFLLAFALTSGKKNLVSQQLEDFRIFKKVLTEKEGRLDLHTTIDSMMVHLNSLERTLSREQSALSQYKLFSKVLARIQCGHTQIHPSAAVLKEWLGARNSLPFDYILQGKKLYINALLKQDKEFTEEGKSNAENRKSIKARSEVLTIDTKTLDDMMEEIGPYLSSDEDAVDFKYYQVAQLFDFYRHMSSPFEKDSILMTYVTGSDTLSTYFQTGTAPVHTMNLRLKIMSDQFEAEEKEFGSFEVLRSKYAYFRFKSFKSSYGKDYETFLVNSFKRIKSKGIKKLIIDIRGNTGGAMQYSLMRYFVGEDVLLGRYVVEKPKKGLEDSHIRKFSPDYIKHKRMSRIQKRQVRRGKFEDGEVKTKKVDEELIFDGEIIVITDEGSFSSASMLACHLKTLCDAKIIGRTAGGSFYRGNAGTLTVQLPGSGFKMFVNPNTFYSQLTRTDDPFEIKQPDIIISPGYLKEQKLDEHYLKAALRSFN